MNEVIRGWWAAAYANDTFICIKTYSGYRGGTNADYKGALIFLSADANDQVLGTAVLDALDRSRWVLGSPRPGSTYPPKVEFDSDLYDTAKAAERYASWVKQLMERYGYKTKRALFKGMNSCSIERKQGIIKITPSHHVKLEAWEGSDAEPVLLPDTNVPTEVGSALRIALSRCTGI